jgi:hypothetical protein
MEHRRLRVYIAGPISLGDTAKNIETGLEWGRTMLRDGLAPYIPHLDTFLGVDPSITPGTHKSQWNGLLEWDIEWVAVSEAFFRIPGESKGADLEMKVARECGIPVFFNYPMLLQYATDLGLRGKQEVNL